MARRTAPAQTVEEARRTLLKLLPRRPMTWDRGIHKFEDGFKGAVLTGGDLKAHVRAAAIIAGEPPTGRSSGTPCGTRSTASPPMTTICARNSWASSAHCVRRPRRGDEVYSFCLSSSQVFRRAICALICAN